MLIPALTIGLPETLATWINNKARAAKETEARLRSMVVESLDNLNAF